MSSSEDHPRTDDVNNTSRTSFQQCRSYTFQSLCKFPNQFSRITGFSIAQFNDINFPAVEPILMEHIMYQFLVLLDPQLAFNNDHGTILNSHWALILWYWSLLRLEQSFCAAYIKTDYPSFLQSISSNCQLEKYERPKRTYSRWKRT